MDDLIVEKVSEAIIKVSNRRCEIKTTAYNFSTKDFDKSVLDVLNLGSNFVIFDDNSKSIDAKNKFENELFLYLKNYRKFIQKAPIIHNFGGIKEWF